MKKKYGFWIVEEQLPFVFPLLGLAVLWFAFGWAQFADLLQEPAFYYQGSAASHQTLHASIYIFFVGIAVLGTTTVIGKRIARKLPESRIAKSAMGFTTLSAIFTLILGVIYGFANFTMNFGTRGSDELVRIFTVYVPIILDAGLLVAVILLSFVARHEGEEDA